MLSRSPEAKALRAGFAVTLRVRGGSMWPLLWTGQSITVEPAAETSLRRDDIAVFETAHGLVAHRVVAVDPWVTRGDRCRADDVDRSALLGRVRSVRVGSVAIELGGAIGRAWSRLSAGAPGRLTAAIKHSLGYARRLVRSRSRRRSSDSYTPGS
jgi:hypothetical protein